MNAVGCTIQALLADSGVSAIVGTKIEPGEWPERQALPGLVINQITNAEEHLLGGAGRYPNSRIRIECLARNMTGALDLGDAVIEALTDLSGTYAGMAVKSWLKEETDETDTSPDYATHRRILEFAVRYRSA